MNNRIKTSFIASVVMCMLAHGYSYFNSSFTMDRYSWFVSYKGGLPGFARSGKWFTSAWLPLTECAYLPWLCGVWVIISFAVVTFCFAEVLDIKHDVTVWLMTGLMVTDLSIICAHFFTPQGFVFALVPAAISVWIWNKTSYKMPIRLLVGAAMIAISLGTYGSYTSAAPTIVVLACIFNILEGHRAKDVFKHGIEYIVTFLFGIGLYYAIQRLILAIFDVQMQAYMGEDRLVKGASISEILYFIGIAYKNAILRFIGVFRDGYQAVPQWIAIIMLVLGGLLLTILLVVKQDKITMFELILLAFLAFVFPLSAGLIYVLAFGNVHQLMGFSFILIYIGFLKLSEMSLESAGFFEMDRKGLKDVTDKAIIHYLQIALSLMLCVCISCVVYRGVLVSNMAYSRLDNLETVSESTAFRILERIETCDGFQGDEKIAFVGDVTQSWYFSQSRFMYSDALDLLDGIPGLDKNQAQVFLYPTHLVLFLQEQTETNLEMMYYDEIPENTFNVEEISGVKNMPCFPADGSVRKMGDYVIVKFTDM